MLRHSLSWGFRTLKFQNFSLHGTSILQASFSNGLKFLGGSAKNSFGILHGKLSLGTPVPVEIICLVFLNYTYKYKVSTRQYCNCVTSNSPFKKNYYSETGKSGPVKFRSYWKKSGLFLVRQFSGPR